MGNSTDSFVSWRLRERNSGPRGAYGYDEETLQLQTKSFRNGIRITYQQDERGRVAGMLAYDALGQPVKGVSYEWNNQGQLVKRTLQGFQFAKGQDGYMLTAMSIMDDSIGFERIEQNYRYDNLGRLVSVTSSERPELNESYVYDASGNIAEKTIGGRTVRMTYDKANQIASMRDENGTRRFEYDSAGRLVNETLNGEPVASFTYGYLDKVMSVTRLRADGATDGQARGGEETQFHYNASGMLVGKEKSGERLEPWQWQSLLQTAGLTPSGSSSWFTLQVFHSVSGTIAAVLQP